MNPLIRIALLLVLVVVLGACASSEGSESQTASSAGAAATSVTPTQEGEHTPDPRPTPASSNGPARNIPRPALPELAKQNTREGFEAFTQHWFDTVTYLLETDDSGPLREASQESCRVCQFQIDKASKLHSKGGWAIGPKRIVKDFTTSMALDANKNAFAMFMIEESPSMTFAKDGLSGVRYSGGLAPGFQAIRAHFDGTKWTTSEAGSA